MEKGGTLVKSITLKENRSKRISSAMNADVTLRRPCKDVFLGIHCL
jgi:hypothetical protein